MRRRRERPVPELPPKRLHRFHLPDWLHLVDPSDDFPPLAAWRAYRAERLMWCAGQGITSLELSRLVPRQVPVYRPAEGWPQ